MALGKGTLCSRRVPPACGVPTPSLCTSMGALVTPAPISSIFPPESLWRRVALLVPGAREDAVRRGPHVGHVLCLRQLAGSPEEVKKSWGQAGRGVCGAAEGLFDGNKKCWASLGPVGWRVRQVLSGGCGGE